MTPDFAAARAVAGPVLAILLAACEAGDASPAPQDPRSHPVSIVGQCAPEMRTADPACAQPPAAMQLFAVECELQLSLSQPLIRIDFRVPRAVVPYHDSATAVFAFRDRAFKMDIFERMILDVDG